MADMDDRDDRAGQDDAEKPADAAPEHKVFVGGISFKIDDRGLKESELPVA